MWQDVSELRQFYASRLGQMSARLIRRRLRGLWPDVSGQRVLGFGYGTPYLRPFLDQAERVIALMPDLQGVSHWPRGEPGLVALCGEESLPLGDNSIDRAVLVHALEASEQLRRLLRELWRVLASGGRMMVVVPNRRGVWARLERTPFGHGHPYSQPQLDHLLRDNMFVPIRSEYALYMPPSRTRMALRLAVAWERVGARWAAPFGGVVITEAEKQVYAGSPLRIARRAPRQVAVPAGTMPAPRRLSRAG